MYGRASSIETFGAIVTQPLGMALVGWGIDSFDPLSLCAICGGLAILAAVLSLLHPQI